MVREYFASEFMIQGLLLVLLLVAASLVTDRIFVQAVRADLIEKQSYYGHALSIRAEEMVDSEALNVSYWKWRHRKKNHHRYREFERRKESSASSPSPSSSSSSSSWLSKNMFKNMFGASLKPKQASWLREPWIPHIDFNETYSMPAVLRHIPPDDELRMLFSTATWPLRKQDILYYGPRVKSLDEPAFDQGVLYAISAQGIHQQYIQELTPAAKLLYSFVASEHVGSLVNDGEAKKPNSTDSLEEDSFGDSNHRKVGMALIIGFSLEQIPEEVKLLFDYIIYDPMSEMIRHALLLKYERQGCLHFCDKVISLLYTPFNKTIYVDCDSRFCKDPISFFDFMDKKQLDISLGLDVRDNVYLQRWKINSGMIGYRRNDAGSQFLFEVLSRYLRVGYGGDQHVFKNLLLARASAYRYDVAPTRYHYLRCARPHNCIVKGDIILFHGRIWSHLNRELCETINSNGNARIVFPNGTIDDQPESLLTRLNRDRPGSMRYSS